MWPPQCWSMPLRISIFARSLCEGFQKIPRVVVAAIVARVSAAVKVLARAVVVVGSWSSCLCCLETHCTHLSPETHLVQTRRLHELQGRSVWSLLSWSQMLQCCSSIRLSLSSPSYSLKSSPPSPGGGCMLSSCCGVDRGLVDWMISSTYEKNNSTL